MMVIWMEQAEKALIRVSNYIRVEFGNKAVQKMLKETYRIGYLLESNPHLGGPEPLLAHRGQKYRSVIVNRINKIVYRIVEDRIEIADFWDTRREPKNQAQQIDY